MAIELSGCEGLDRTSSSRTMVEGWLGGRVGSCGIGLEFGDMKLVGHTDSKSKIASAGVPAHGKSVLLIGFLCLK